MAFCIVVESGGGENPGRVSSFPECVDYFPNYNRPETSPIHSVDTLLWRVNLNTHPKNLFYPLQLYFIGVTDRISVCE